MHATVAAPPLLEVRGISKRFGAIQALRDVSLQIAAGEVRALVGRNGAGKSTLVKILAGAQGHDAGSVVFDGEELDLSSPSDAAEAGISTVYQELSLIPGLTVAENVTLGAWPTKGPRGVRVIDRSLLRDRAAAAIDRLGVPIPLTATVSSLTMAERQLTEIAKGMVREPRLLILDEPTSSLAFEEVETLLGVVRRLGDEGVAVIYVSHRMDEIPRVAHSITVLRDGRLIETLPISQASTQRVTELIVGPREASSATEQDASVTTTHRTVSDTPALEIRGLHVPGRVRGVNLMVRPGEVLGIAGLLGSGRTEVLRSVIGAQPGATCEIRVRGDLIPRPTPRSMLRLGVSLTPEDRAGEGLVLPLAVAENLVMAAPGRVTQRGVRNPRLIRDLASEMVQRLAVKVDRLEALASSLSGGNQQKLVIGKSLNAGIDVLLLDEPTRGIDVEAKRQIYALVQDLARDGMAVVFVSSELEELPGNAHRIIVLRQGAVVDEQDGATADVAQLLHASMGEA
jgi:sugar transport system ATP-binding protein